MENIKYVNLYDFIEENEVKTFKYNENLMKLDKIRNNILLSKNINIIPNKNEDKENFINYIVKTNKIDKYIDVLNKK